MGGSSVLPSACLPNWAASASAAVPLIPPHPCLSSWPLSAATRFVVQGLPSGSLRLGLGMGAWVLRALMAGHARCFRDAPVLATDDACCSAHVPHMRKKDGLYSPTSFDLLTAWTTTQKGPLHPLFFFVAGATHNPARGPKLPHPCPGTLVALDVSNVSVCGSYIRPSPRLAAATVHRHMFTYILVRRTFPYTHPPLFKAGRLSLPTKLGF